MTQDPLTLYKLIVLYMLNRVNFPMTKAQIGDFILDHEYTNFLTLQQVISELIDANMITAESIRNRTHLAITKEGQDTLEFFKNRISEEIIEEIDHYFQENEMEMRNEVSIVSDYYKSTNGEYEAHLLAKDKDVNLVEIKISVPSEEGAASICENWEKKNQVIYQYLIEQLF
mgnify:FL=1